MADTPAEASNLPPQPTPTPEDPFWTNLKGLGYCLFSLIAGVALLGWQGVSRWQAAATLQWPTTAGMVLTSEIEEKTVIRGKRIRQVFEPTIEYSYQVDGKDYVGTRIGYIEDAAPENEQTAAAVSSKYPVGRDLKVSYNPHDHAASLLEPGMTANNSLFSWLMIGLGGFLTLVGLLGSVSSGYQLVALPRANHA